jgi:crotonobetainyl-CoA:carnitine CoA-transferase CaiB-like acyl-CoA transferase
MVVTHLSVPPAERAGPIRLPGNPARYGRSATSPGRPPPTLGEHTSELREAFLGPAQADGR